MYSKGVSEEVTGKILKELANREKTTSSRRSASFHSRTVPTEKAFPVSTSSLRATTSLRRLGHDYIDLYQIHRLDHHTPMEETLEALDSLVRVGESPLSRGEQYGRVGVRDDALSR